MATDRLPGKFRIDCTGMSPHVLASFLAASEHTNLVQIGIHSVGLESHLYADNLLVLIKGKFSGFSKQDIRMLF
jgi:hypothetical protein